MKILKDVLPYEFMGGEYDDSKARKFIDVEVIESYSYNKMWIGKEKYVKNWWVLKNGYAVGWNENPIRGWSFIIKRLKG